MLDEVELWLDAFIVEARVQAGVLIYQTFEKIYVSYCQVAFRQEVTDVIQQAQA